MQVKERYGIIERLQPDGVTAICKVKPVKQKYLLICHDIESSSTVKGLFKKESDISVFAGFKVGNHITMYCVVWTTSWFSGIVVLSNLDR